MQSQLTPAPRRFKYTKQQRDVALTDAESMGTCAAARKHGLPDSTLSRWRTERRNTESPVTATAKPAAAKPVTPARE